MVLEFVYILLISLIVGTLLGIEREIKFKPIGLRTFPLIVLSSSALVYFGAQFGQDAQSRIIAAVIMGFGFLGAGVIFRPSKGESSGLTTGALVVLASVVGTLIGKKYFIESIVFSLVVLFILVIGGVFEKKVLSRLWKGN